VCSSGEVWLPLPWTMVSNIFFLNISIEQKSEYRKPLTGGTSTSTCTYCTYCNYTMYRMYVY